MPEVDAEELLAALVGEPLLPAWYDDWVLPEREHLEQLRVKALERIARHAFAMGDLVQALDAARAALDIEPLLESARELTIRAHLGQGDRGSALREFHRYRDAMRDDLGVAPSPTILALVGAAVAPEPSDESRPTGRPTGRRSGRRPRCRPRHRPPAPEPLPAAPARDPGRPWTSAERPRGCWPRPRWSSPPPSRSRVAVSAPGAATRAPGTRRPRRPGTSPCRLPSVRPPGPRGRRCDAGPPGGGAAVGRRGRERRPGRARHAATGHGPARGARPGGAQRRTQRRGPQPGRSPPRARRSRPGHLPMAGHVADRRPGERTDEGGRRGARAHLRSRPAGPRRRRRRR